MGRLLKIDSEKLAYIAGFIDGDGSIMLQLRKKDGKIIRVKTVICLYQDTKYRKDIEWMQKILRCGYVYNRNDNICELRIEGFQRVFETLILLKPFLRLKKKQAELLITLIPKLQDRTVTKDNLTVWIEKMREYNYYSSQRTILEVPVTTDMEGTG